MNNQSPADPLDRREARRQRRAGRRASMGARSGSLDWLAGIAILANVMLGSRQ